MRSFINLRIRNENFIFTEDVRELIDICIFLKFKNIFSYNNNDNDNNKNNSNNYFE